jgi:hypothetical protein
MTVRPVTSRADGAWGLRFPSLTAAAAVLVHEPAWPVADVEVHALPGPHEGTDWAWDDTGMSVPLPAGGHLEIVWPAQVRLGVLGAPTPECVVTPHLATAAASIALRRGRQAFHAGAFATPGGAWAILGAKEAGKSSTLALASEAGLAVLTDDLLVVDDGVALVGPRCIDLREPTARALGIGTDLGVVGQRERWRVHLGDDAPHRVALAGWVLPAWGDDGLSPVPALERLRILLAHSSLQGLTMNDPDRYLALAALPMLTWSRPCRWSSARGSFARLLDRILSAKGGPGARR